ncbi:MAG: C25 family cysteine peptidase, partial [Anaerolineae bacterium]
MGDERNCYTELPTVLCQPQDDCLYLDPPAYKLHVLETGLYQVRYADLLAAGVPVDVGPGIDPATLQLFSSGAEVAIWVEGGDDASFDPGNAVLFYGEGLDTRFTGTNVYWLTYGKQDGLRMGGKAGTPSGTAPAPTFFASTRHLEENRDRNPRLRMTPEEDNWWWKQVLAPGEPTQAVTFTLPHPAAESYSATLRTDLHGRLYSNAVDPDHHAQVFLNGHAVDDIWWDGFEDHVSEVSFPSSHLQAGTNIITITAPNDTGLGYDAFFVNWFDIDLRTAYEAQDDVLAFTGDEAGIWCYRAGGFSSPDVDLFDVSDPLKPARILSTTLLGASGSYTLTFEDAVAQPTRYLALTPARRLSPASIRRDGPSALRGDGNGADYIAISHADFITEVLPLADYRAAKGLRSVVVDVQNVYDEFGYGVFDPEAIQRFLAHTYEHWVPPAPSFVLLIGNGHFDYRGYASTEPNYVPPYMLYIDRDLGEVAADNRYVAITGDDILPDMRIGRLPVSSPAETAVVVDKILAYEENPPPGDWVWRSV